MRKIERNDMSLFEVAVDSRPHNHRKKVYLEDWRPFSAHFDQRRFFHRYRVNSEFADSLHDDSGISTLTSSINNKIGRKLLVADDLQIGMEIAFGRMKFADGSYIYKHHGIVIKISETCNRFEIVELRATESAFNTCLAVLCRNSRPSVQRKTLKFHDNLYYYDYQKISFSRKLVKKRAKKMVLIFDKSGVEYNLTKFNCEHFACYCATGLACSGQTENENLEATESLNKTLGTYIDIQIEKYSNNTQKPSLGGKVLETMKPKERSCVVM
ncbi:Hypothetical predicted protein [Mytilus galloprovincialis]|uniref:LRAT domain-containing protein n=1 Tax=Mytilus galloprovincialis TaxID=29158 RepID=A0A8B6CF16_MYTGA|nr:Hypothetical predicted protein [Mytilus galloprovincialis]